MARKTLPPRHVRRFFAHVADQSKDPNWHEPKLSVTKLIFIFLLSGCGPVDIKVMSGDIYQDNFQVENLLTRDEKEKPGTEANGGAGWTDYWLAKDRTPAIFVLDLGCKINFD
jgi:hypothetical protein